MLTDKFNRTKKIDISLPLSPQLAFYQILPQQNTVASQVVDMVITSKNKITSSYIQVTELVRGFKFEFPVIVKIERIEESLFIAECPTFNISIPAESYEEAVEAIKEVLVDDYQAFLKNYPQKLTREALKLLRLYCALFGNNIPQ